MRMPTASDRDKDRFRALVAVAAEVEVKPMFGNLGAFVNGNMFAGLLGSAVGLKLPPADLAAVEQVEGSGPFGPPDRPMRGYVALPPQWLDDLATATPWVQRAVEYVAGLPGKPPRATARRKPA